MKWAGQDATEEFDPIHPRGTIEDNLEYIKYLGALDSTTSPRPALKVDHVTPEVVDQTPPLAVIHNRVQPRSLNHCINITDIERFATSRIPRKAWAYYFSAGDDLISKSYNNLVYQKILLRPRVFIDCTKCDTSTSFLQGTIKSNIPFYVSPAAQARLSHPDGEGAIAQACAQFGALQIISNNASMTPEQIVAASPETTYGFQLYIQKDIAISVKMLQRIRALPQIKFICLTLDAPVAGKREHDERQAFVADSEASASEDDGNCSPYERAAKKAGGIGKAMFAGTATDLTWHQTLKWLKEHAGGLPVILKGIQTHEDAYIAAQFAPIVKAVILSNHGGRALDTAPPAVHTLLEIRKYCPEILEKIEIWVDGGIRRGTDIVKALCLGAKAVGIGRAALWGVGAGGREGVEKVLKILKEEVETCMRLLGVGKVEELGMRHVS